MRYRAENDIEDVIMLELIRRKRTTTETEDKFDWQEDDSGNKQAQLEAITANKKGIYIFVIKMPKNSVK